MFSFIKRIQLRISDIKTINSLFTCAEIYAHKNGEDRPGEEHLLLSALDLPDGTVRRIFESIGADPRKLEEAINKQYNDALSSIGIDASKIDINHNDAEISTPKRILYDSKPSVTSLMKELVKNRKNNKNIPLLGAHVLEVIASKEQGVAARTLRTIGINRETLKNAVQNELRFHSTQTR